MQSSSYPRQWVPRVRRWARRPIFALVVVLALVVVAIWVVTLWEISTGRTKALDAEVQKNSSVALLQVERVLRSIQLLDQAMLVLRHDFSQPHLHENFGDRVKTMQLDSAAVSAVTILDASGNLLFTTTNRASTNFADRDYFKHHASNPEDRLAVGKPIVGRLTNMWVVPLTRRINKPDGSFAGVIYMAANPGYLMSEAAPTGLGVTSTFALVGLDGIIRLRNKGGVLSYGDDVSASRVFKELANTPIGHFIDVALYDGKTRATSFRTVDGYPLVVAVGSDVADVLDDRKKAEGVYIGLALLATSLVILLGIVPNTAWSRIEAALKNARASERKFRSIIDASPVPMTINNLAFEVTYVNAAFTRTYGYALEDIPTLQAWWPQAYPDPVYRKQVINRWNAELGRSVVSSTPFEPMEIEVRCKDGSAKQVMAGATALTESFEGEHLVVLYDITDQKTVQASLHKLVQEKNALLREVHHRVKNNLQVITSLLRLEGGRAPDTDIKTVLNEMQWRIRSMALLHESLYRSDNFESVQLDSYIKQISSEVLRSGSDRETRVSLVLELAPVTVSMNQATPCGLIVNELVSNVLKHGFADGRIGMLKITLTAPGADGRVTLRVCDNGIGLPPDFERRKADSLGVQLVTDLVTQLRGSLAIGPLPKAAFVISFVPEGGNPS